MGILMHQVLQNHGSTRTVSWLIKKAVNDKNIGHSLFDHINDVRKYYFVISKYLK